jgi:hypothetical protein
VKKWYHLAFLAVSALVLVVLLNAPKVTTPRLPADPTHATPREYARCPECHGPDSEQPMPLAGDKPHVVPGGGIRPEFVKCYMCHKPREG